ncbi:MAG TPA: hypothetical protein VKG23_19180 [Thermoanaerobaculia bacterium]|nr:hypothetical protein [Thermoanaerobaculia bacterium]
MSLDPTVDPGVAAEAAKISRGMFVVGVIAFAVTAAYAMAHPDQFFHSYLLAFMFWNGLAVGSLAVLMLQYLTGGAWGIAIRRELEAATRTLPFTAIAFLPIVFGMHRLYEWTHADVVANDPILQKKAAYLNEPFFLFRAALAFAVWILIAFTLNRWSREQDASGDKAIERKLQLLSGGGLVAWALTTTWTSIDWVMSVEPHWYSTMYGVIYMAGQGLGALSLATFAVVRLSRAKPVSEFLGGRHLNDLGKMMFAFTMFWAYVTFSQYLIIWSGNLPEEITWYLARFRGGWGFVGLTVLFLQFVLPFLLLLSRQANRNPRTLLITAALVVVMRFVDLAWMILPAFSRGRFVIHPTDLSVPVALGALWLGFYFRNLAARPLLPIHDSGFEEALAHGRD